ncbi:hypothetical protein BgiMline_035645 [Biomphalaria glabrata]|uniref:Solute carrier organic anion transporter family member n=2 Tax=Biomphalaria glabrata TaxID=6526 RepID=A0A9W2Z9Y8_BIOGL|nr:solute carrier organic anion transporter family member 2A1-like isoform X1 [Biomphalaria glabrata]KAI8730601.1 solute carrier organic anion transporter family member 2A1 [Biomphalaria glabrata]
MSTRGYRPVQGLREKKDDDVSDDAGSDTRCGILSVTPNAVQPCANMVCFTAFYGIAALLTSTLTSYVNSQVTTLERQFGFTSKQTGLIMAANDIGFLICVLFVSYSSTRVHIPRSLGIATVTFGISGLSCSLPHFIFGARVHSETFANVTSNQSQMYGDFCDASNSSSALCNRDLRRSGSWSSEHVATISLGIIVVGMMLQGFGKAPRASLVVTYVDDNTKRTNTGIFMGCIVTLGILGPAVAYTMGGLFSKMYVSLEATTLTPKHPNWIGAWWLGYVVFGILSLVISIPLFWFPRKLPQRHKATPGDIETVTKNDFSISGLPVASNASGEGINESTKSSNGSLIHHPHVGFSFKSLLLELKGFLAVLVRLWTNPIYTCTIISSCFVLFTVSAIGSYTPKYMERMFNLPAYKANYIMAGKSLCASCIGTFLGGYLTKRLKMTAKKALLFISGAVFLSFVCTLAAMFFQCEQPTVHNWPGSTESCYDDCHCEENKFFAICGQDGKTYYSPCTAGCKNIVKEVYQNCTCIVGGTAVAGFCDYGCNQLYAYAIFSALGRVTGTLAIVPKIILIIRCVENRDKGFALGFQAFMTSLFGWLLGPIIIGYVIDGICTVWDVTCGTTGRCLLYDNDVFRVKLHSYCATSLACSFVVLTIACIYARCTGCLDEKDQKNNNNTKTSPLHLTSVNSDYSQHKDITVSNENNKNADGL